MVFLSLAVENCGWNHCQRVFILLIWFIKSWNIHYIHWSGRCRQRKHWTVWWDRCTFIATAFNNYIMPDWIHYSLNKKEWICSLFKEWILEKSEIRVNLEWIWSEHLCYSLILEWPHAGITRNPWVIPVVTPKWVNNTNVHSKFTLISLFSKMHSLKSEHIHSFLFREYKANQILYFQRTHPLYTIFSESIARSINFQRNHLYIPLNSTHMTAILQISSSITKKILLKPDL